MSPERENRDLTPVTPTPAGRRRSPKSLRDFGFQTPFELPPTSKQRVASENHDSHGRQSCWSLAWSLLPSRPASFNSQRFAAGRFPTVCIEKLCLGFD